MSAPALLLIDMQVDFAAPDGAMARLGKDLRAARSALAKAEALAEAARVAGITAAMKAEAERAHAARSRANGSQLATP